MGEAHYCDRCEAFRKGDPDFGVLMGELLPEDEMHEGGIRFREGMELEMKHLCTLCRAKLIDEFFEGNNE